MCPITFGPRCIYINIECVTRAQNILPEGKQGLTILGSCLYIKKSNMSLHLGIG